jgi:hypothetical protein
MEMKAAMFNLSWGPDWTNFSKPVDSDRPFHRVSSPVFSLDAGKRADGKGFSCGCHSPDQYSQATIEVIVDAVASLLVPIVGALGVGVIDTAFRQALRGCPAVVPVGRTDLTLDGYHKFRESEKHQTDPDREMEVEGVLWRSFQTSTDIPLAQWHKWYDWNFHVVPARGYEFVRGKGNDAIDDPPGGWKLVGNPLSMECEWDCGAFHSLPAEMPDPQLDKKLKKVNRPTLIDPGPMFHQSFKNDWAWPMAGQYFWGSGRWIYDCGHAAGDLMRTELHPCKAIATARWEAARFKENEDHWTPAIQFMFFASRFGGYMDFDDLGTRDYEFIIDLPPLDPPSNAYTVGHTPEFPLNTLELRPKLLHSFDTLPFRNAKGDIGEVTPVLTILVGEPGEPPKQAKVKIPLTDLRGKDKSSYGVIISLGWFDFDGTLAERVKEVEVIVDRVQFEGNEPYQIKIGVNGRWAAFINHMDQYEQYWVQEIKIGHHVKLHLDLDQTLSIAVHGLKEGTVGEFMDKPLDERRLENFNWDVDIDQPDLDHTAVVARGFIKKRLSLQSAFGEAFHDVENEPIGIIDPGHPSEGFTGDTPNPITVRQILNRSGGLASELQGTLTGCFTKVAGDSGELIFKPGDKDYTLHYRVIVRDA